jgi:hypothetical protein
MAPKEGKKAKGGIGTTDPAAPPVEDHSQPTSGIGKFYYANGATYEGEWVIAAGLNEGEDAEAKPKGSPRKGDKGSKDDAKKKGTTDAKADEKHSPKSPKKEAAENKKSPKWEKGGEAALTSADAAVQQQEEHPRPNYIRHGKGLYIDGEYQYEGEWKDDKISGLGTFRYASGAIYEGNWDKNKYSGEGEYKWGDGRSYKGFWRESKMHGMGGYVDQSGQRYVGHFFNGIGPGLSCDIK